MTPHEHRVEQRKQIWSGCQTILGWAGLIALAAFFYYAAGLLPKSVPRGHDVVVFLNQGVMQNNIFGCALFGSVFFFSLLAATK